MRKTTQAIFQENEHELITPSHGVPYQKQLPERCLPTCSHTDFTGYKHPELKEVNEIDKTASNKKKYTEDFGEELPLKERRGFKTSAAEKMFYQNTYQ